MLVPWADMPFKVVDGDLEELRKRAREERPDEWETVDLWVVDVPDGGKLTKDVLGLVKGLAKIGDEKYSEHRTKHLKRVRKAQREVDGVNVGCK